MKKHRTTTTIYLPRGNHAKCPIYEHEGKYYIKANKPNTSVYRPFYFEGIEYSPVHCVESLDTKKEYWFLG